MISKRNSNIEMLRIIAMLFIAAAHMFSQTSLISSDGSIGVNILIFFGSGARIAVNIFLFIGIWFMTEKTFSAKRPLELYLTTFLYTVGITLGVFISGNCSVEDLFKSFMPYNYNLLWFTSAYITLHLISPFLNYALMLQRKKLELLLFILAIPICFYSTFKAFSANYLIDLIYFWFAYLFIGYIKLYHIPMIKKHSAKSYLNVGVIIYSVLAYSELFSKTFFSERYVYGITRARLEWISDIKSIPNIFISLCIFMGFIVMKPRHNNLICRISKYTFDVYTIHQVPAFYHLLWTNIMHLDSLRGKSYMVPVFFSLLFLMFTIFSLIGFIREELIFRYVRKNRLYSFLLRKTDEIYQKRGMTDTKVEFPKDN